VTCCNEKTNRPRQGRGEQGFPNARDRRIITVVRSIFTWLPSRNDAPQPPQPPPFFEESRPRLRSPEVDAKALLRREIKRLRALRVKLAELAPARSHALFERFAGEFVGPERAPVFLAEVRRAGGRGLCVDPGRWLRPDCAVVLGSAGCARWLAGGRRGARCVRFDRRAGLPAVEIAIDTMDDVWAASWPGLFVSFDAGRALAVSIDYEVLRSDLRVPRASPYR
jgi:hypothetical protein